MCQISSLTPFKETSYWRDCNSASVSWPFQSLARLLMELPTLIIKSVASLRTPWCRFSTMFLNLLLKIPLDISFQTQIPLTIAYCPESSIYRRWCPKQGGVSPLHKEVRASQTLSKVLGGVTPQPSEGVDHPPSLAPSDNSTGSARLQGSRRQSHSCAQSITPAHSQ